MKKINKEMVIGITLMKIKTNKINKMNQSQFLKSQKY